MDTGEAEDTMTSRERIETIFSHQAADRCGFWLGCPRPETWPIYLEHFGFSEQDELRRFLGDDFCWISADSGTYKGGKTPFGWALDATVPVFADCEDAAQVKDYDWADARYLDFAVPLEALRASGDVYRASGMWTCFFHVVADYFGMENYFVKMYTHPGVVDAVTERVCDFYFKANERFFQQAGDEVDAYFFGNDLGTQLDLLVGPEQFDRFILPYVRMFADQGHAHGYQVMMHCCGAVSKLIDRFIDAGTDALHPLQALARGMEAENLARRFRGRIAFCGGIDTQQLLVHGTPDDVRAEVRRVKRLLGPCLIVSPSHEALLPNVPPENVLAMARAAVE